MVIAIAGNKCDMPFPNVEKIMGYNDGNTYSSYFGSASINPLGTGAPLQGRPVGKTRFFTTGSAGDIIYPANHHRFFHTTKDQLHNNFDKLKNCLGRMIKKI